MMPTALLQAVSSPCKFLQNVACLTAACPAPCMCSAAMRHAPICCSVGFPVVKTRACLPFSGTAATPGPAYSQQAGAGLTGLPWTKMQRRRESKARRYCSHSGSPLHGEMQDFTRLRTTAAYVLAAVPTGSSGCAATSASCCCRIAPSCRCHPYRHFQTTAVHGLNLAACRFAVVTCRASSHQGLPSAYGDGRGSPPSHCPHCHCCLLLCCLPPSERGFLHVGPCAILDDISLDSFDVLCHPPL